MTGDDEGDFVHRWARRKQQARRAASASAAAPADAAEAPPPEAAEPEFDPAALPALDSLGADSDYTVFLKPGVPKALRAAALRRAWGSDPAITGHRPLVDYDWNYNAPGYGKLWPSDDPRKLAEALFRHLRATPEPPEDRAPEDELPAGDVPPTTVAAAPEGPAAAVEPSAEGARGEDADCPPAVPGESATPAGDLAEFPRRPPVRRHGSAVPT